MNNSHAVEVLYLGDGEIDVPFAVNKSQNAVLIGSIVGSVIVGLAFIFLIAWILYKRSRRKDVKSEGDPDDFEIVDDVADMPSIESPASTKRIHSPLPPPPSSFNHSPKIATILKDPEAGHDDDPTREHVPEPKMTCTDEVNQRDQDAQGPNNLVDERNQDEHDHSNLVEDQDQDQDEQYHINLRDGQDQSTTQSEDVVSSLTQESDFIVSRIKRLSSMDDSFSFHNSEASSIDDEMIETLENLIRVDDWQGITPPDFQDNLSISDRDENMSTSLKQSVSTLSKEDVQSILRTGQWEKLSKSSTGRGGNDRE